MTDFGWSLPPGVTQAQIDAQCEGDEPERDDRASQIDAALQDGLCPECGGVMGTDGDGDPECDGCGWGPSCMTDDIDGPAEPPDRYDQWRDDHAEGLC
jgi:hypothetical protein